jgi:hypothetical protein
LWKEKFIKIKIIISFGAVSMAAALFSLGTTARATVVDLTSGPPAQGTINDAIFAASDLQPAGTGVFDPFLRVEGSPTEQGYNTDGGFPFNDKPPSNFQHSLLLSSLTEFNISGVEYYKFTLDGNKSGTSNHEFSLDQLQIYTSNNGAQTTTTFNPNGTLPLGHLAYNLNPGGGASNYVLTTATGAGKADMYAFIPVSDFLQTDKYVTLYFESGAHIPTSGGFEQWSAATRVAPVPEVTPVSVIFGFVGLVVAVSSRRVLGGRVRVVASRNVRE